MIDDDIRALREAIAAGPTPGTWTSMPACIGEQCVARINNHEAVPPKGVDLAHESIDARYIAAASPDRIARLLDEIERLQVALANATAETEHFERAWDLRGKAIERLRARRNELERMAEDAERYRWLRDRDNDGAISVITHFYDPEALDAAIDAARKGEGK